MKLTKHWDNSGDEAVRLAQLLENWLSINASQVWSPPSVSLWNNCVRLVFPGCPSHIQVSPTNTDHKFPPEMSKVCVSCQSVCQYNMIVYMHTRIHSKILLFLLCIVCAAMCWPYILSCQPAVLFSKSMNLY